jgi:hypothetical protein
MGLYLCVFASARDDDEIGGVEVGSYDDFHVFRVTVAERLEGGRWGSRFPVLMSHADSDGSWSVEEAAALGRELRVIEEELATLPATGFEPHSWQGEVAAALGIDPSNLGECFIDVDGEPLLGRLRSLVDVAVERERPISFQ